MIIPRLQDGTSNDSATTGRSITPEYSVGVWVGNFDGSPMREVSESRAPGDPAFYLRLSAHEYGTSWYRTRPESWSGHHPSSKLLQRPMRAACRKIPRDRCRPPNRRRITQCGKRSSRTGIHRLVSERGEQRARSRRVGDASDALQITSPLPGSVYVSILMSFRREEFR